MVFTWVRLNISTRLEKQDFYLKLIKCFSFVVKISNVKNETYNGTSGNGFCDFQGKRFIEYKFLSKEIKEKIMVVASYFG